MPPGSPAPSHASMHAQMPVLSRRRHPASPFPCLFYFASRLLSRSAWGSDEHGVGEANRRCASVSGAEPAVGGAGGGHGRVMVRREGGGALCHTEGGEAVDMAVSCGDGLFGYPQAAELASPAFACPSLPPPPTIPSVGCTLPTFDSHPLPLSPTPLSGVRCSPHGSPSRKSRSQSAWLASLQPWRCARALQRAPSSSSMEAWPSLSVRLEGERDKGELTLLAYHFLATIV